MHNTERSCLDFSGDFSGESKSQRSLQCVKCEGMLCPQVSEADFPSVDRSFPNSLKLLFLKMFPTH